MSSVGSWQAGWRRRRFAGRDLRGRGQVGEACCWVCSAIVQSNLYANRDARILRALLGLLWTAKLCLRHWTREWEVSESQTGRSSHLCALGVRAGKRSLIN